tara:strand:- start:301 stop:498 length:198 start_codon:yes stop_codon:yes gene_type:complete
MAVTKYLDKRIQKCPMCAESTFSRTRYFEWIGMITKDRLEICFKCAKREVGTAKKSQERLRKLYE